MILTEDDGRFWLKKTYASVNLSFTNSTRPGQKSNSCPHGGRPVTTLLIHGTGDLSSLKVDSHIACRAHAIPLPCRAAKSLECVFPIWFTRCSRVWFTLAMSCPCRAHAMLWPCRSSQGHGTARRPRDGLWATCPLSVSSVTTRSSTKIVIRSIPILLTTIHTYDCKEW